MAMQVKEVASLAGISIRTLHHYDDIDLLKPTEVTESGYRLYVEDDLEMLQQILLFKELGLSLKEIKAVIYDPSFNKQEALELHQQLLIEKRNRLNRMIAMTEQTIKSMKGEKSMTNKQRFEGFDFSENPYEEEAKKRWGNEKVNEANKKVRGMTKGEQADLAAEANEIYKKIAKLMNQSPSSESVQKAIQEWFHFLNRNFTTYSPEAFKGLGELYIQDERFQKNIDQFGEGLAEFLKEAMGVFADSLLNEEKQ
ncbi:MerR family transcriptional regulator [Priestia flexa]|uniref:MerR family transcriptional regulator n=1 Tax=Priestia flexa TaxID=86664 RepID=UPI000C242D93|nr:MerR family transcriptional regulator [Priestia flexa]MEC0668016.1 MerR family transcriptional regulator [Priestia flexa]MED3825065.1 MerR family transcriptional regulator [Priestia flexa]